MSSKIKYPRKLKKRLKKFYTKMGFGDIPKFKLDFSEFDKILEQKRIEADTLASQGLEFSPRDYKLWQNCD